MALYEHASITSTSDTRPVYGPWPSSNAARQWALFEQIDEGIIGLLHNTPSNPKMRAMGFTDAGWYIRSNQTPVSQQGGSGGGGSGSGSGFGAIVATQSQPALTGGGMGWKQDATTSRLALTRREGEFQGLDTLTPPEKLGPGLSPWLLNIDQAAKIGSRCKRRGIAKMAMDGSTLHDGSNAQTTLTFVPAADYTADTDYVIFVLPNGTTHSFWLDTTGGDTEPQGSQDADASTQVDISGDTSAADVGGTFTTAFNGASIGATATDNMDGTVRVAATTNGHLWRVREQVADDDFLAPQFDTTGGSDISSDYRGLGLAIIPASGKNTDRTVITLMADEIGDVPSTADTGLWLTINEPCWGRPATLKESPGPNMALTQIAGTNLRARLDFENIWDPTDHTGIRNNSLIAVTVMYSTDGFPRDIDNKSEGPQGTYLAQREPWDGPAQMTFATVSGVPTGRMYVAAWAHTREGVSNPTYRSLTIT